MAERRWAIVVGASQYELFPKLKYAARDAAEFRRALTEQLGFEMTLLLTDDPQHQPDFEPTRSRIFHSLACLSNKESSYYRNKGVDPVGEDDLFVFYFSGHGLNSAQGDQYLLAIDSSDESISDTAVDLGKVSQQIANLQCRHKVLFIDACRSEFDEQGAKSPAPLGFGVQKDLDRAGIATFYSCDPKHRSYEIDSYQHGSFTYCLLAAVKDASVNTLAELNDYLESRVPTLNANEGKRPQKPFFVPNPKDMGRLRLFSARQLVDIDVLMAKVTELSEARDIKYADWDRMTSFLDEVRRGGGKNTVTKLAILQRFLERELTLEQYWERWRRAEPPASATTLSDTGPQVDLSPSTPTAD